ncbi:olfactory receptor 6M1-like [Ascaphus truei]|uniref:olfactory receptor 6M1-like n=1 Tax=Ascaphus truei TaxID=8439 RepID=UPI003F598F00
MVLNNVTEFILLGLSSDPRWLLGFALFIAYLVTLTGNILVILLVITDVRLQTPMYFFLCNLSLLEISFTSTVIPKMLQISLSQSRTISFVGCFVQSFFYFLLGTTELILLAVMSFDRYLAICQPLHYCTVMSHKICLHLCWGCWLGALHVLLLPSILIITRLPFCGPNVINHFFCDSTLLIKLSCADISMIELVIFVISTVVILGSLIFTTISYIYIISTVLRIPSGTRRLRTFSTCASHLTVVLLYYGSSIFMYVRATQNSSLTTKKIMAVLTAVVTPAMSPFIYSLRNKKVTEAVKVLFCQSSKNNFEP